ncbi:MAG: ABC transporter permease [Chryseolinea sp.]
MNEQLPKWMLKFLKWFCPEHLYEEIEGDLIQKFNRDVKAFGDSSAKRRLVLNSIRFFRPGIILRNKYVLTPMPFYMLANYFKIALRIMLRNKGYSAINIFGLAFGMTGAILLGLWISREFSYDQFHADKERIYKAWNRTKAQGEWQCWDITPRVLAPTLVSDFSSVESAVSLSYYNDSYLFSVGDVHIMKNNASFADPEFLTMFSFPLIKGDAKKALGNANSIVLTEGFAHKLFGDKEAFGESLTISQAEYDIPFTVTGILKDLPSNTDFHFEFLIPWQFIESNYGKDTEWNNNSVSSYVKIKEGISFETLNREIKDIKKKNTKGSDETEIFLYPITKMHLYSRFENGVAVGGRIEIMRMLGILGVCLVVIACINFINLSTARAARRSKEVAVRKVTGAFRYSLIVQFLCESVLVAFGAGVISLFAVYLALPFFNTLVQQQLELNFSDYAFWVFAVAAIVFIGLMAGSYPAFYLSSFQPVRILKGVPIVSNSRNVFRSLLVIFQFGFALTLITSTVVIYQQTAYLQNRESGYAKNNLVYQLMTGDLIKNFQAYKNELIESGVAVSVTRTSSPITERLSNTSGMKWNGKDPENKSEVERFYVDENISATAGVKILKGRDMNLGKYPSDSTAVLLNESAVNMMGFKEPLGEIIEDNGIPWHVVGVVQDFILTSPYKKVEPIVLLGSKGGDNGMFGVIHIRLNPEQTTKMNLATIAKAFSKYNPDYPFEYHFVDVEYARKFANVKATLTITSLFSGIAIFIGCLGLLGLSTYMIEARVKEIGIRKVMGGSVFNIIRLLSGHSLKPIVWGILIFSPGAWWAMNWWLQSFEYRISFSVWVIVAAAASILLLALLTITLQIYKAARVNPIKSLRTE